MTSLPQPQELREPDVIPDEEYAFNTVRHGVVLISSEEVYAAMKHLPDHSLISSIMLLSKPAGLDEGSPEASSHFRMTGGLSRSDWHSIYLHCVPTSADLRLLLELEWSCIVFRICRRYSRLFEFCRLLEGASYSIADNERYVSQDVFAQLMVAKILRADGESLEPFITDAPATAQVLKAALIETFAKTGIEPEQAPPLKPLLELLDSQAFSRMKAMCANYLSRRANDPEPDISRSALTLLFFLGEAGDFRSVSRRLDLDLSDNQLFPRDFRKLSEIDREAPVEILNLSSTPTTTEHIESLRGLSAVEELNLAWTKATNSSIAIIARFATLRRLNLESTSIDDNSFSSLEKLKGLQYLNVRSTKMTSGCIARLIGALPDCQVVFE